MGEDVTADTDGREVLKTKTVLLPWKTRDQLNILQWKKLLINLILFEILPIFIIIMITVAVTL